MLVNIGQQVLRVISIILKIKRCKHKEFNVEHVLTARKGMDIDFYTIKTCKKCGNTIK